MVSVDPKRVYVACREDAPKSDFISFVISYQFFVIAFILIVKLRLSLFVHFFDSHFSFLFPWIFEDATVSRLRVEDGETGPNGEEYCWWQVTVKGGRETRNLDAVTLARVSKYMNMYTCAVL